MLFTDNDLKQLEEQLKRGECDVILIPLLIARLEAAEAALEECEAMDGYDGLKNYSRRNVWRAVSGES